MKVIILGKAGAGKTTLARTLMARHPAACLSRDEVAFQAGAERRPPEDSIEEVMLWMEGKESWSSTTPSGAANVNATTLTRMAR